MRHCRYDYGLGGKFDDGKLEAFPPRSVIVLLRDKDGPVATGVKRKRSLIGFKTLTFR